MKHRTVAVVITINDKCNIIYSQKENKVKKIIDQI